MAKALITFVLFLTLQGQLIHGRQIDDLKCPTPKYRGGSQISIILPPSSFEENDQNQGHCRIEPHLPKNQHSLDLAPKEGITFLPLASEERLSSASKSLRPMWSSEVRVLCYSLYSLKASLRI
jgi:hypothetical protein